MSLERLKQRARIVIALCLCLLVAACSSSSDSDGAIDSDDGIDPEDTSIPVNDSLALGDGERNTETDYCGAAERNAADPAFVAFDFPANDGFDALRDTTTSLQDLAVLTQLASFASNNQFIPTSRLFCDYEQARDNGCTATQITRTTVRDVVLAGSTLSFSVDTEDGQASDYVIESPDYSIASLQSTSASGAVFALDTARDSTGRERLQANRSGRVTVVNENPDCSGSFMSTEGMMTTLSAEWTSPSGSTLTLIYELCENGAARGTGCTSGSLTVQ